MREGILKAILTLGSVVILAFTMLSQSAAKDSTKPAKPENALQPLSAFTDMKDEQQRAHALFKELGKVIQHPRCVNCHPRTERPLQGENGELHQPLVVRGLGGIGAVGMFCTSCHGAENFQNMPGNPAWHLAPASMPWVGKSLGEICEQIKDKERNGGKTLAELGKHMAEDELVSYGWSPPAHLEPVPGTQQQFGELFYAWLAAGAHCPAS